MTTTQMQAWLDQEDSRVANMIRRYGWSVEYVFGGPCGGPCCDGGTDDSDGAGGPPFAYTIGLFGLGHPELLILGVPMETACGVLNELGQRVRDEANLVPGQLLTFDG